MTRNLLSRFSRTQLVVAIACVALLSAPSDVLAQSPSATATIGIKMPPGPAGENVNYGGGWMNCTGASRLVATLYKVTVDADGNESLTKLEDTTFNSNLAASGTITSAYKATSGLKLCCKIEIFDAQNKLITDDRSPTYSVP